MSISGTTIEGVSVSDYDRPERRRSPAISRVALTLGLFAASAGFTGVASAQSPGTADLLASTPVRVTPSNPVTAGEQGVNFGESVALDRELLVVGAPSEDSSVNPGDLDAGAVYVFERQGDAWVEIQKLRAPTQNAFEQFGHSVAVARGEDLDGPLDVLVVGGPWYSGGTGRAYVFHRRTDEMWEYETHLQPTDPQSGDRFGTSVSIDWFVPPNSLNGDPLFFIAVGAPFDDDPLDPGNSNHGSVGIFQRAGGPPTWGVNPLSFYGMDGSDHVGQGVALAGPDVAAAGEGIDTPGGFNDGGAQTVRQVNFTGTVFNYALSWELQTSSPQLAAGIGKSVALHYDTNDSGTVVLGAPLDDTVAANSGKLYIFDLTPGGAGTTRTEVASILGSGDGALGVSVGITRRLLVAGSDNAGPDVSGQVLVWERGATKSDWTHVGEFDPPAPNPPFDCNVGDSVAIQEATVAVGCPAGRVQDEGVYIYFIRPLFEDGFESGDTTAWSSTTP